MSVPPGLQESTFADVIRQWTGIVGARNVYTDEQDLDRYRDRYSVFWGERDERVASAAVAPGTVEEVQQIVRLANRYRIPLYPISTGMNLGYGGAAPVYSDSVVLDLKRMNRIIEFNEEFHYVIVEPGVSFFDLNSYLRGRGSRLYASIPATGWGSPIGNALDRGMGAAADGDNFANHRGMEVVLANGDIVRTGMGALPNSKSWALFNYGYGPSLNGVFCQSNFGIVTKMGFNLFTYPDSSDVTRALGVASRNYEDLARMLSLAAYLEAVGVTRGEGGLGAGGGVASPLLSAQDPEVVALHARADGGTPQEWNALAGSRNLDVYRMTFRFSGARRIVDAQFETALEACRERVPDLAASEVRQPAVGANAPGPPGGLPPGTPTLRNFWSDLGVRGWTGHVWFSPRIPRIAEEIHRANKVFGDLCRELNLPFWGWRGGTTILYSFNITRDPAENRRVREAFLRMVRVGAENGWSEYRTAPAFMDAIAGIFSFNDGALLRLQETIKDAIDPNGILSAGRYGIWPKHLRETRRSSG